MTDEDSVRITATSRARRRALAGVRTGESRLAGRTDDRRTSIVLGHCRDASIAGVATREADAKRRPEMAPQRLEKIKSAPGNGMGPEASNPLYLVPGRAADRARLRVTSRENDKSPNSRAARDPVSPPCSSVYECRRSARSRHAGVMAPARPRGKFSALQRLENARNRERISIFCGALPRAGGTPRGRGARSAPLAIRVRPLGRLRMPSAGSSRHTRVMGGQDREGNFPPRKALKTHKMEQKSQLAASNLTAVSPAPARAGSDASALQVHQPMLGRQSPSGAAVMKCGIEIEVAPGELIDKLTILEIKRERIHDPQKRANVEAEFAALQSACEAGVPASAALLAFCAPNCARSMAASGRSRMKSATASSGRTSARRSSRSRARSIRPTTGAPSSNAKSTCCSDRG